jgi:hypothetical protein
MAHSDAFPAFIDLQGYVDESGVEYLGEARRVEGNLYRCLANLAGSLCLVEIKLTPKLQEQIPMPTPDRATESNADDVNALRAKLAEAERENVRLRVTTDYHQEKYQELFDQTVPELNRALADATRAKLARADAERRLALVLAERPLSGRERVEEAFVLGWDAAREAAAKVCEEQCGDHLPNECAREVQAMGPATFSETTLAALAGLVGSAGGTAGGPAGGSASTSEGGVARPLTARERSSADARRVAEHAAMSDAERLLRGRVRLLATHIHNRQYRDVARALGTRGAADLFGYVGEIPQSREEDREVDYLVSLNRIALGGPCKSCGLRPFFAATPEEKLAGTLCTCEREA